MLDNIRTILVNTSHPGNIGSSARAMKTMGLSELYLVQPHSFPNKNADALASNAVDVLERAVVVDSLAEAIADCSLIVGTSTRSRTIPWPLLTPREFAEKAREIAPKSKIAVIYGREQSGLTNEELHQCHFHIQIPTNPDYSSLNLAAAVQVIAYELQVASLNKEIKAEDWDYPWATAEQMESFYEHMEKTLVEVKFLNPDAPRQLMTRLRRLFYRARMDEMEVNIMRGILGSIQKLTRR